MDGPRQPRENQTARIVAHRAGNAIDTARAAAAEGYMVEVDVHVFRGRVEVRHEKVIRPFSRLWEPWELRPRGTGCPELLQILDAVGPGGAVLLDLKCFTRYGARRIRAAVPEGMDVVVSSRSWWTLGAFKTRPDTLALRSCANRAQLWLGTRLPGLGKAVGITAHQRLLSPELVAKIRERSPEVFSWGLTSAARCRTLMAAGLTGVVLDDPTLVDT